MRPVEVVRRVAPKARSEYVSAFESGDALLKKYGITTRLRLAHFLAQVLHESGGLTLQWESGAYSAKRLLEVFGAEHHSARVTPAEASKLAYKPELIFERVYGLGNPSMAARLGNTRPGDGYRYRGGGILQTTGRGNYQKLGRACGVDFESSPELVVSAEHALKPALAEWGEGGLNAYADRDDVLAVSRGVNLGNPRSSATPNGMAGRRAWLAKAKQAITGDVELTGGRIELPARPSPSGAALLARRVAAVMERRGYRLDRGPGEVNVVYVEGMDPDGTPNLDKIDGWNDLRLVLRFEGGGPVIAGKWIATTEPGSYYTQHPINAKGAARIEFGQYSAWRVGVHRGDHEALVQTGGPVTVCRDLNRDGERAGDARDTGYFGINQHWGYDLPSVGKASAGCLVGQSKVGHREFMALVKSDPRYEADHQYVFAATVLPAADVVGAVASVDPPAPPEGAGGDSVLVRIMRAFWSAVVKYGGK